MSFYRLREIGWTFSEYRFDLPHRLNVLKAVCDEVEGWLDEVTSKLQ